MIWIERKTEWEGMENEANGEMETHLKKNRKIANEWSWNCKRNWKAQAEKQKKLLRFEQWIKIWKIHENRVTRTKHD